MSDGPQKRGPQPLARLVGRILDPVTARRGFAAADLIASWDDVVGERLAGWTRPDRLSWPRGPAGPGVLTLHVEGARAVLVQHEAEQIMQRINGFLGFPAVAEIRILQRPVGTRKPPKPPPAAPSPAAAAEVESAVAAVEDEGLRAALRRLGIGIVADRGGSG